MATVTITSHTLEAGNSIIQIRNISEVGILQDNSYREMRRKCVGIGLAIIVFSSWVFATEGAARTLTAYLTQAAAETGIAGQYLGILSALLEHVFVIGRQIADILRRVHPAAGLVLIAIGVALIGLGLTRRPVYELILQTNAGALTMFSSRRLASMRELVAHLRRAMADTSGNFSYHYTDASIAINDSAGVIFAGQNATVNQNLVHKTRMRTS